MSGIAKLESMSRTIFLAPAVLPENTRKYVSINYSKYKNDF